MNVATSDQVFRFGDFTLDLGRGALTRADEPLFLAPKAYAVLTHLARNRGRVVPKAELMDTVWPGVFVTEDSLTRSIREIRKAIGETPVRTVSKRGYMLAAESEPKPASTVQPIAAVLRFRNESGARLDEPIVDGFAEDIINGLARFGTITVLARNSSFAFASYVPSQWPEIRARIGADFLVEGSVRREGERVGVAVSLIDTAKAIQIWGERYHTDAKGLFGVQDDIVGEIVSHLAARVEIAGVQRASRKPLTALSAWELVYRAAGLLRDPAQIDAPAAEALCREAITGDPSYGLAWTYLAVSRAVGWELGGVSEAVLAEALAHADKGVALSPDLAACRRVQSLVRTYLRQHEAAEHHLKLALELNPHDADSVTQMGFLATLRGRPLDALAWSDRSLRLNPLDTRWAQYGRSLAFYQLGEYADAAKMLLLATRLTPWVRTRLAACYGQLGQIDEARRQIELINKEAPDFSPLDYVRRGIPFESAADTEHLADGVLIALGEKAAR